MMTIGGKTVHRIDPGAGLLGTSSPKLSAMKPEDAQKLSGRGQAAFPNFFLQSGVVKDGDQVCGKLVALGPEDDTKVGSRYVSRERLKDPLASSFKAVLTQMDGQGYASRFVGDLSSDVCVGWEASTGRWTVINTGDKNSRLVVEERTRVCK